MAFFVMAAVSRQVVLPYTTAQMYALVGDIESYPDFVPGIRATRILDFKEDGELAARIDFTAGPFHKSFSTRNRMRENESIDIELLNGPFRHLEGGWRFDALENASCGILVNMTFEFHGRLLSRAMDPLFKEFIHVLINSFKKRALEIYGPPRERKS